jgi:hypothetical protein
MPSAAPTLQSNVNLREEPLRSASLREATALTTDRVNDAPHHLGHAGGMTGPIDGFTPVTTSLEAIKYAGSEHVGKSNSQRALSPISRCQFSQSLEEEVCHGSSRLGHAEAAKGAIPASHRWR